MCQIHPVHYIHCYTIEVAYHQNFVLVGVGIEVVAGILNRMADIY